MQSDAHSAFARCGAAPDPVIDVAVRRRLRGLSAAIFVSWQSLYTPSGSTRRTRVGDAQYPVKIGFRC